MLKAIDVTLRNSIEFGVAVGQSHAETMKHTIVFSEQADMSPSSSVVIARANNTTDVLVE